MLTAESYQLAIEARKELRVSDCPAAMANNMKSLSDIGWDGEYVVPNQLSSSSFGGPVLVLNNWSGWLGFEGLEPTEETELRRLGYTPEAPTNRWINRALQIVGLTRQDIYITQACVLLPQEHTGSVIPAPVYKESINRVLKIELAGRTPIALGTPAQRACSNNNINFIGTYHPSYQGGERRAQEIAAAIKRVM